jgi:hypothetical protein
LKEKYDYVDSLLSRMGLAKVADTIVGDEKVGRATEWAATTLLGSHFLA